MRADMMSVNWVWKRNVAEVSHRQEVGHKRVSACTCTRVSTPSGIPLERDNSILDLDAPRLYLTKP
jgi:hypothetical protein